jgi:hypothetical protein
MNKKVTRNGTNGDKLSESTTDKDSSTQNEGSDAKVPTTGNNIESINGEKTVRKSKPT